MRLTLEECAEEADQMVLKRNLGRLSAASISPIGEFVLRFVRTLILSRLLMPDDLGAAIALITIISACEVVTDVGNSQFVKVNAGAQAVAAAQQIAVVRSVLLAIAIAVFAPTLASAFGASAHVSSIRWLGAVSLIGSLRNLRIYQIQQEYRFGPEAISNVMGQAGGVIAVIPAALWFRDEHAMLASLVIEAVLSVMLSYLLVPRERVHAVSPAMRRAALMFGLPLMANGIALVALSQLDRLVVAQLFDLASLALYSLALSLAVVPTSPLGRTAANIGMPFLARSFGDPEAFREASLVFMLGLVICAALSAIGVGLLLEKLVPLFYGAHYHVSPEFCILAAAVTFLRIWRIGVNVVLLVSSQTARLTVGNLMAGFGLLIGFLLAILSRRLEAVVAGLVMGDLLSLVALLALARVYLPMGSLLGHGCVLAIIAGVVVSGPSAAGDLGWIVRALMLAGGTAVIGLHAAIIYKWVVADFLEKARTISNGHAPVPSAMSATPEEE